MRAYSHASYGALCSLRLLYDVGLLRRHAFARPGALTEIISRLLAFVHVHAVQPARPIQTGHEQHDSICVQFCVCPVETNTKFIRFVSSSRSAAHDQTT